MVARQSTCLRRLGEGCRAREVGFGRFLANHKVTVEGLIAGWSEQTGPAAAGRHVLAIQDTSEINFRTTEHRRRGLGEIGKGVGRGVLAHVMLAVDAPTGSCLGLVTGCLYTRPGRITLPHAKRPLEDKESRRWIEAATAAKTVLHQAARVTVVADRESDIYAEWASVPGQDFHLLTRVMHDRATVGGTLYAVAAALPSVARRTVELPATPRRVARRAELDLRFGPVEVIRPRGAGAKGLDGKSLPGRVPLTLVEAVERDPPDNVEPVHWRLLTTHAVADPAAAWQIVEWYKRRWIIEQLFRLMKTQGLQIEESQLANAEGLRKLAATAVKAAAVILQLVQAREGSSGEPAENAFTATEIAVLTGLNTKLEKETARLKNPHPANSLAWAAWIVARIGGWNGYPSSRPPGPITIRHGFNYFRSLVAGWELRDVCIL